MNLTLPRMGIVVALPVSPIFSKFRELFPRTWNTGSSIAPASITACWSPSEITVIFPPLSTTSKSPVAASSSSAPEIVRLYVTPAASLIVSSSGVLLALIIASRREVRPSLSFTTSLRVFTTISAKTPA